MDTTLKEESSRPRIGRRREYAAQSPQEEFIVPLLKQGIEAQLRDLLTATSLSVRPRFLDAGCGAQPFRLFVEATSAAYFSLDASRQDGVQIDFVARLDDPFLDRAVQVNGPYDVILCSEVLEHVADWDTAFANLERLLASGGSLVLTAPHFFPLHEEPFDFWRPTPYAIRHFAEKYGFRVAEEYRLGSGWDILGTLLARQEFAARSGSLHERAVCRACKTIRRVIFLLLRGRTLQHMVRDTGPFYIANLQVLRKGDAAVGLNANPPLL